MPSARNERRSIAVVVGALFSVAAASVGCHREAAKREVTVSAAISLREPMEALARAFERDHPGAHVVLNFGATGDLARQIEAGAPVDVFAAADEKSMDRLASGGLLMAGSRRALAQNRLALIALKGTLHGLRFADLARDPRVKRVALGAPATVPAGAYAKALLDRLGVLLALDGRIVYAANARQVLDYVVRGEVDAGVVYVTDAAIAPTVEILDEAGPLPAAAGLAAVPPIRYPIAVLSRANDPSLSQAFVDLATGPVGRRVLAAHGFLPPE